MHKTVEVICAYCGKHFQRDKYHANKYPNSYCNDQCRGLAKRKRLIRVCATCGKEYETTSKRSLKYCSRDCGWQAQIGQERPYMKGRPGWGTGRTKETDASIAKMADALRIKPPPRDELYQLFTVENLPYKEIGKRFGVTSSTSKKWITAYGLLRKRDLLTKELLTELYDAGYTHREIGEMHACSIGYVGQRTRQHGIKSRYDGTDQIPDRELLHRLYWDEYKSYEQIGQELGVHPTTVCNWFVRFGIPARIPTTFGCGGIAKDGHKVKSIMELQVDDWLSDHGLQHNYEPSIPGTNLWADFFVAGYYVEVWGMMDYPPYKQRHDEKVQIYRQNNLRLLSIYPDDFPILDVLSVLLPQ